MIKLDKNALASRICEIVQSQETVLFAGAGCSALVGIPTWDAYVEGLAAFADKYEPEIAALMRKRTKSGKLLEALTHFKTFLQAPEGEKWNALTAPFSPGSYNFDLLLPLASLPFTAVVTTNFDSSLCDAFTQIAVQRGERQPEILTGKSIQGISYLEKPYFLFLHGRGSLQLLGESMVLDEKDYSDCYSNPAFTDGLLQILSHKSCLFIGFSFRDPGINTILDKWTELKGPTFPIKHFILLSEEQTNLASKLFKMNAEPLIYKARGEDHSELWEGIRQAARKCAGGKAEKRPQSSKAHAPSLFTSARNILKVSYARASLSKEMPPLRDTVLEGIVFATIQMSPKTITLISDITDQIGKSLGVPTTEIAEEVKGAVERLAQDGLCHQNQGKVTVTHKATKDLSENTKLLAESVIRRMKLRLGKNIDQNILPSLATAIEELFIARAWDLAAHFVQPRSGALHQVDKTVAQVLQATDSEHSLDTPQIRESIIELLTRPNKKEATILADLGRLAFAVQLALSDARTTFSYTLSLPERVYLDASILMPAIVNGHPLQLVYKAVLDRLRVSAHHVGRAASIIVPTEFLNEVIAHRENAIHEVRLRQLDSQENLKREVRLFEAQNLNVFIGAYSTIKSQVQGNYRFTDFLRESVPYENEEQLGNFIKKIGIQVETLSQTEKSSEYWGWYNRLKTFYESYENRTNRKKHTVLIEHEAWQLLRLEQDHLDGIRSVFVTDDNRLRRAVSLSDKPILYDALFSGIAITTLIDLLLGVKIDHRGLARLLWGIHAIDARGTIHRYFTDLGLQKQGDVETLVLPKVVEQIMHNVESQSEASDLESEIYTDEGREKIVKLLDRFEEKFYDLLEEAVEEYKRKHQEELAQLESKVGRDPRVSANTRHRSKGRNRRRKGKGRKRK